MKITIPHDKKFFFAWYELFKKLIKKKKIFYLNNTVTIVPMAGKGQRFFKEGYSISKPFIKVTKDFMVNQAIKCLPKTNGIYFGRLKSNKKIRLKGHSVFFNKVLKGQACSTAKILKNVPENISLLITSCDNGIIFDHKKFINLISNSKIDIVVFSYTNNFANIYNPEIYSWLKLKKNNSIGKVYVKKFIFKNPLKEMAIVGTFYFKNKNIFLNAFKSLLKNKHTTNNEYYIDDLINESIKLNYKVKNFTVDNYVCWGTPNDLSVFQYFQKIFSSVNWHPYRMHKDFMYKKLN
jgi:hypothetical protein